MKIGKLRYCIGGLVGLPMVLAAQNPIVQTMYTADPAPMVYDGKLFLYTSHDEDASTWFVMNEWKLYSTTDMVNWTDHGAVLSYETFSWAKGDAWAMQCVERDGKFYAYVPVTMKSGGGAIGVPLWSVPRSVGQAVGSEQTGRHRPNGLHRRRRAGLSVLGESVLLLCETE